MLYENAIVQKDMDDLIERDYLHFEKLKNKTVLVTGASGMLAYYFTCALMHLNLKKNYQIKVLALVRNKEKAEKNFEAFLHNSLFELVIQDVCAEIKVTEPVHYIVHAAGGASPYQIKNNPLGIIHANLDGTVNVCELAKNNPIEKVLYTSTREVYGKIEGQEWIREEDMGSVDPIDPRSCYPESKRMAEQIFRSYEVSCKIPFNIVRIAHSYGPGMIVGNDGRVMADFMTNVIHGEDIVLKSAGDAIRAFCYITDAVAGMFCVLLDGEQGQVYNIANETEPYMIRDVARMLIEVSGKEIQLVYDTTADQSAYCNYKRVGLATDKIEALGWKPEIQLKDGLDRTLQTM